ncbi:hypothetical protein ACHWQZ_G015611 [Mnemiopsis leidyi]
MVRAILRVEHPRQYLGTRKENLNVIEVGRFNDYEEPMTAWAVHSGDEIPPNCKIPHLHPPTEEQLPLSLRTERTSGGVVNQTSAVERILTWAGATEYSLKDIDVVAGRNALRRVSQTPYYRGEKVTWSANLARHQDTLFLELTKAYGWRETTFCPLNYEIAAWGTVFEDIMTTGGKGTPGYDCRDTNIRVPRLIELGSIKTLTNGKVHSQTPGGQQDVISNYVDVKLREEYHETARQSHIEFMDENRKRDTWTQCALLGIETVFCGERTKDGTLIKLEEIWTEHLEHRTTLWKPEGVLSFLENLLVWLKDNTENGLSYTLNNNGRSEIVLEPAEHGDLMQIVLSSTQLSYE